MDYLQESYPVSGARACGLLRLAVSSYYYQPHSHRDDQPVRSALRRHAAVRLRLPRIGGQTAGLFMKLAEPTALSPTGRRWA